ASLHHAGVDAHISQTAGTYVCNAVFYALMHGTRRMRTRAGFVHLPYLPEQGARHRAPAMLLDEMIRALEIIVRVSIPAGADARIAGGAES
ncbi:MAG TPA: pyroglutamyl-peptidase I, partial [Rhodanobacteraceae bacterium]